MPEARVCRSIAEIGRDRWEACAPGALEGYDYLEAVERAGIPGFQWRYPIVEQSGQLLCAAPAFISDYSLDTTLTAFGRKAVGAVRRVAPRAFILKLGSLGSPCTEDAGVIFAPDVAREERSDMLASLLTGFSRAVQAEGCGLIAIKDAPTAEAGIWDAAARAAGFARADGLPTAMLDIDFADIDGYLARLSAATRKDMRRKLKALDRLKIEVRERIDDVIDRVHALYRATRERADMQFEELTPAYFTGVLARMPGRSFCVLYRDAADGEILAANLLIHDGETLLDKYFCMDGERARDHNLYFVSWFTNVRLCLERHLKRYQSGQAGYANKLRLGSRLAGANMYFRHRNPVFNQALAWAAPLLSEDQPEAAA